jgi:hypothetical protein
MADRPVTADRVLDALKKDPDLMLEVRMKILAEAVGLSDYIIKAPTEIEPGQRNPDGKRLVVCQDWLEHERGWGSRPDGYTLHLTLADRDVYVVGYDATFNNRETAPDTYVEGRSLQPRIVAVEEETYQMLVRRPTQAHQYPWRAQGAEFTARKVGPVAYTPPKT